ncbi:hypothetical protein QG37_08014 [Candidozyma auris]|uniref:Uncharacterized protein n=1 Tax=Candidozyma auris TaxID=498019 RepID=A0A0L0NNU5_CANAR|nr:hypothetical protein QG37_08014 [[Candida] auris]
MSRVGVHIKEGADYTRKKEADFNRTSLRSFREDFSEFFGIGLWRVGNWENWVFFCVFRPPFA